MLTEEKERCKEGNLNITSTLARARDIAARISRDTNDHAELTQRDGRNLEKKLPKVLYIVRDHFLASERRGNDASATSLITFTRVIGLDAFCISFLPKPTLLTACYHRGPPWTMYVQRLSFEPLYPYRTTCNRSDCFSRDSRSRSNPTIPRRAIGINLK